MDKPTNIEQYKEWLKAERGIEITKQTHTYFDSVAYKIHKDFTESAFWRNVLTDLNRLHQRFFLDTKYKLFLDPTPPTFDIKSFPSFLLKTFRKNVLNNAKWPDTPEGGWFLPDNWIGRVNDIVRTYFTVKYLDGVTFFARALEDLANKHGLQHTMDFEAKEEGYYAVHFYVTFQAEIPTEGWDTRNVSVSIEIQITTQLQEVIRNLLHKYYEDRRKELSPLSTKWQWDYRAEEFSTNYLGHILHYIEGMIMEIRDKQSEGETT